MALCHFEVWLIGVGGVWVRLTIKPPPIKFLSYFVWKWYALVGLHFSCIMHLAAGC